MANSSQFDTYESKRKGVGEEDGRSEKLNRGKTERSDCDCETEKKLLLTYYLLKLLHVICRHFCIVPCPY